MAITSTSIVTDLRAGLLYRGLDRVITGLNQLFGGSSGQTWRSNASGSTVTWHRSFTFYGRLTANDNFTVRSGSATGDIIVRFVVGTPSEPYDIPYSGSLANEVATELVAFYCAMYVMGIDSSLWVR